MKMSLLAAMAIAAMLAAGCASVTRPDRTLEDLVAARRADDTTPQPALAQLRKKFMARIEAKAAAAKGRARFTSTYSSDEALQRALDMGVEEGTAAAIDQIDGLVAS